MLGGDENGIPFKDFCFEEWRAKYGVKPPWMKKDYMILAAALKTLGDEAQARSCWKSFLQNKDPFNFGHSPGKFVFNLSMWAAVAPKPPQPKSKSRNDELLDRMAQAQAEVWKNDGIPLAMKRTAAKQKWEEIRREMGMET